MIHLSPAQTQHTATTADEALLRASERRKHWTSQPVLKTIHYLCFYRNSGPYLFIPLPQSPSLARLSSAGPWLPHLPRHPTLRRNLCPIKNTLSAAAAAFLILLSGSKLKSPALPSVEWRRGEQAATTAGKDTATRPHRPLMATLCLGYCLITGLKCLKTSAEAFRKLKIELVGENIVCLL